MSEHEVSDNHSVCSFDDLSDCEVPVKDIQDDSNAKLFKELAEIRQILEAKPSDLQAAHETLVTKFSDLTAEYKSLKSDCRTTVTSFEERLKDTMATARAAEEKRDAAEAKLAEVTERNGILDYNNAGLTKEMGKMNVEFRKLREELGIKIENGREMRNPFHKLRTLAARLSPENVRPVTDSFLSCTSSANKEQMMTVIGIIFDQAVDQPKFGALYARLCKEQADDELKNQKYDFQSQLYDLVKNMFKNRLPNDTEYLRQKTFAVFSFVGHLYLNGLADTDMVSKCIDELLTKTVDGDQTATEASVLCGLEMLERIGETLDNASDSQYLFDKLNEQKDKVNEKLKDRAVKLLQKRDNGWKDMPMSEEGAKKAPMVTVITIGDDEKEERLKKSRERYNKVIGEDHARAIAALKAAYNIIDRKYSAETVGTADSATMTNLVETVLAENKRLESDKEMISWQFRTVKSACQSQKNKFIEQDQKTREVMAENDELKKKIRDLQANLKEKDNFCCSGNTFEMLKQDYIAVRKARDPWYEGEHDYDVDSMVRELMDQKRKMLSYKAMEEWKFNTMKKAYQAEKEKRMALEGKVAPVPVVEDAPKVDKVDEMIEKQIHEMKMARPDCRIGMFMKKAALQKTYADQDKESGDIEFIEKEMKLHEILKTKIQKVYAQLDNEAEIAAEVAKIHEEHAGKVAEMRRRQEDQKIEEIKKANENEDYNTIQAKIARALCEMRDQWGEEDDE